MSSKNVVPREQADHDANEAIVSYRDSVSERVPMRFVDALEESYAYLIDHSGAGSPRYSHELDIPGLRFWRLTGYPYLVFYIETVDVVDVWRVLHEERDLPQWLTQVK